MHSTSLALATIFILLLTRTLGSPATPLNEGIAVDGGGDYGNLVSPISQGNEVEADGGPYVLGFEESLALENIVASYPSEGFGASGAGNTTVSDTFVTCYAKEDPDFSPSIPGFNYDNCAREWNHMHGLIAYEQVIRWWSDNGSGQSRPDPPPVTALIAGINRRGNGCAFLLVSSMVLDQFVTKSIEPGVRPFPPEPVQWRPEWGPRGAPYTTKESETLEWGRVVEDFRKLFDCIEDGKAGHKRIGNDGTLHVFAYPAGTGVTNFGRIQNPDSRFMKTFF